MSDLEMVLSELRDMKADIRDTKSGMKDMRAGMKDMRSDMEDLRKEMKSDMEDLNKQIRSIEMTLENSVNKNISIIAENHLDLSRKLDEVIKLKEAQEKEMFSIRINVLEDEVRKIKEQMSATV